MQKLVMGSNGKQAIIWMHSPQILHDAMSSLNDVEIGDGYVVKNTQDSRYVNLLHIIDHNNIIVGEVVYTEGILHLTSINNIKEWASISTLFLDALEDAIQIVAQN